MSKPVRMRDDSAAQIALGAEGKRLSEAELLALEDRYCSHGDTVHYINPPGFELLRGLIPVRCRGPHLP